VTPPAAAAAAAAAKPLPPSPSPVKMGVLPLDKGNLEFKS